MSKSSSDIFIACNLQCL